MWIFSLGKLIAVTSTLCLQQFSYLLQALCALLVFKIVYNKQYTFQRQLPWCSLGGEEDEETGIQQTNAWQWQ